MKRSYLIILISTIVIITASLAYLSISPDAEAWAASDDLMNQEYYGFGYDLGSGEPTEPTKLFRAIISSPKSHLVFRKMYDEGDDVAKAYAIAGLHQSLLGRFDDRIDAFRKSGSSIPVVFHPPLSPEQLLSALSHESFQCNIQENIRDSYHR